MAELQLCHGCVSVLFAMERSIEFRLLLLLYSLARAETQHNVRLFFSSFVSRYFSLVPFGLVEKNSNVRQYPNSVKKPKVLPNSEPNSGFGASLVHTVYAVHAEYNHNTKVVQKQRTKQLVKNKCENS